MPRKRKKSGRDRKAPLIFTESPVDIQRNVPSPVCCALHPRTAQTIPVEQLNKSSWVSPQFSSNVQSGGPRGRRALRRRRKSSADINGKKPECTCGSTSHDQVKGQGQKGSKYRSLEFVENKRARTSISVLEEVSIEENASPNVPKHQRKLRRQSRTSWIDDRCDDEPVLKRKVRQKNSRLSVRSVERDDINNRENLIGSINTECSPLPGSPVDVSTPVINKEDGANFQTPVKRLFPGKIQIAGHLPDYIQPRKKHQGMTNSPFSDTNIQSPVCDSVCDSDPEEQTPKSRYFLRKYFEMTVCSTPKDGRALGSRILVLDTPETEYGLPARKRQLGEAAKEAP
ncbi:uncharacterized protein [Argopecten irradians]|uniref:uncharacterized protein n=1 Tax=Argopecten irradians TaxID=31199 RepID=UPI003720E63E